MLISVRPCAVKNQTVVSYDETQSRHAEDLAARPPSVGGVTTGLVPDMLQV